MSGNVITPRMTVDVKQVEMAHRDECLTLIVGGEYVEIWGDGTVRVDGERGFTMNILGWLCRAREAVSESQGG